MRLRRLLPRVRTPLRKRPPRVRTPLRKRRRLVEIREGLAAETLVLAVDAAALAADAAALAAAVVALAVDAEDVADAAAVMTEKIAATKSVSLRLIVVRR